MTKKIMRTFAAVMLVGTGVHGLTWLTRLLIDQGLERAEKILSAVTLPATIVIGCGGLWLTWRTLRQGGATGSLSGGRPNNWSPALRYWAAGAVVVSMALNLVLVRLYLPNRLPELAYEVRVGVSGLHPGWSKQNEGQPIGEATGFDMELVRFLEERFDGNKWTVVKVNATEREQKIVTGEIQLVISNYSMEGDAVAYGPGLERRALVDFAGPYFLDTSGIIRNPRKIGKDKTLPPEKVCIAKGTTAEDYVEQNKDSAQSRFKTSDQEDCFKRFGDLRDSTVLATVTDSMILKARARSMGIEEAVLPQPDSDGTPRQEKYGIGMPNRHPKLCSSLNDAIADFIKQDDDGINWKTAWSRNLAQLDESPESHRPPEPRADCTEPA